MKKRSFVYLLIPTLLLLNACGNLESSDTGNMAEAGEPSSSGNVDVCRCLTEDGNSDFSIENRDACRDAISNELGVGNWEQINFSEQPELSARFEELVARCSGETTSEEGSVTDGNEMLSEIGAPSGYIWENVNMEAQIYTTLAFHEGEFRISVHNMNNQTDSKNFTTLLRMTGSWTQSTDREVKGLMEPNQVEVGWEFNNDYTSCINNKGVTFTRVKVQ